MNPEDLGKMVVYWARQGDPFANAIVDALAKGLRELRPLLEDLRKMPRQRVVYNHVMRVNAGNRRRQKGAA